MQKKIRIKKGDKVIVLAGKDKGKSGTVKAVMPKVSKLVVEGINMRTMHKKPSAAGSGGIVKQEAPIHVSNVSYFHEESKKAEKIGYRFEKGQKVRFLKRSGNVIEA